MADTLLDLLSVLVEFWCQQHLKLNQNLVEKGLKDLGEHFAVISQGKDSKRARISQFLLCVNVGPRSIAMPIF